MRPDKWFSDLVSITYRSLHLSNSLLMDSYCPITHSKILLCPPLNTSKRTSIHSFLSLFMLRHTSIHSYDIPEEANSGGRCAWSVQQTWPDTSLKWSARLATGVSADPLFNYLALAYKHTDALPMLLCSRIFRQVPVTGTGCFILDTYWEGLQYAYRSIKVNTTLKSNLGDMLPQLK